MVESKGEIGDVFAAAEAARENACTTRFPSANVGVGSADDMVCGGTVDSVMPSESFSLRSQGSVLREHAAVSVPSRGLTVG